MKKIFTGIFVFAFAFAQVNAQSLTKEQKKQLKEELKGYLSDLEGYNAKKQDLQNTLDSNDAEIKRLKDDYALCSSKQSELENRVTAYNEELKKAQQENAELKGEEVTDIDKTPLKPKNKDGQTKEGEKEKTTAAGETENKGAEAKTGKTSKADMKNAPKKGTIYKVQIGLYEKFNINKYFDEPKYMGYEMVDGMNRYVVGYFNDETVAESFVKDVRKMGIKDAFVAKYVDGKRVFEWNKAPK
jgi:glucan-binding YG repeat protein